MRFEEKINCNFTESEKNITITKMDKIQTKRLKYFKSDFDLDKDYISSHNEYNFYLWIVRESGTYLLPLSVLADFKATGNALKIFCHCLNENITETTINDFDFETGKIITKKLPKKHRFYFVDVKNSVVKEFRKDKQLNELIYFMNDYIRDLKAA